MAALRDGRIDFTTFENPDIARTLAKTPNIAVAPQKTTNYFRIDVNALNPKSPFHDKRVRQAMNLALDRDAINNLVFAGTTSGRLSGPRGLRQERLQGYADLRLAARQTARQSQGIAEGGGPRASARQPDGQFR